MHQVHEGRDRLGGRVAQRAVPGFVDAREVAVEAGDAEQIAGHREETLELLLRPRTPDEFPELLAERGEHAEDLIVRLEDRPREELEDADDLLVEHHRQAERRMQPRVERGVAAGEGRLLRDVGDPARWAQGHVRPGPTPWAKRRCRVSSSNWAASISSCTQSTHRSSFAAVLSTIHITPTCQCSASATERSTHAAAPSIVEEFARASMTAYWARRWRSARFVRHVAEDAVSADCASPVTSGTTVRSMSTIDPSFRRRCVSDRALTFEAAG
jgi:hypothetical protein